ncbi:hypothetical protein [Streptomyces sp. NPDC001250]|uniref:hypothetical protein n=1 Tax=unclassified Streptomyces TaxID=2593676 RepID=UPI00332C1087
MIARRDTLHRLAAGDRALLPDRACAFLERMPGLGYTADDVTTVREALVLVRALVPEGSTAVSPRSSAASTIPGTPP